MVRVRPLESSPSKNVNGEPNLFSDPQYAFLSFRDPYPGEAGDRNVFRQPGYVSLDAGLYKSFNMPWENHQLTFRWEVYNVTNTQRFTAPSGNGFGLPPDPFLLGGTPPGRLRQVHRDADAAQREQGRARHAVRAALHVLN